MMGRHPFAVKIYYQLSLDDLVPKRHLLRRIAEAIDFTFVYQLARPYYSYTGQPSIDPVVLFKALLIGYLYGITSERRLLEEIEVNLAHRWFIGYDLDEPVPDHSVLSKARVRFGMQVFEAFFTKSVDLCKEAGLVNGEATFVDSTFMRANAAMSSLEPAADHEPPLPPRQYVERLFEENAANDSAELDSLDLPEISKPRHGTKGKRLPANKRKRSRTDPDASVINHMNLGVHLAYKTHIAVDDHPARVITAAVATPGETSDEHILGELLRQNRHRLGRLPKEVVADARYGTKDIYRGLEERGIHAVIPDRMGPKLHPGGVWTIREFKYNKEKDAYECAAGQWLPHVYTRPSERMSEYIALPDVCVDCEFRDPARLRGSRAIFGARSSAATRTMLRLTCKPRPAKPASARGNTTWRLSSAWLRICTAYAGRSGAAGQRYKYKPGSQQQR